MSPKNMQIKLEHEKIKQYLIELEIVKSSVPLNLPNLTNLFKKLLAFWDEHEKREEYYLKKLREKDSSLSFDTIIFEHGELKQYRDAILKSIKSKKQSNIQKTLKEEGSILIEKLREHMEREENMLLPILPGIKQAPSEKLAF